MATLINTFNRLRKGTILDVSNMSKEGSNTKIYARDKLPSNKVVIDDLPLASDNYENYHLAIQILGDKYSFYALKYKDIVELKLAGLSFKDRIRREGFSFTEISHIIENGDVKNIILRYPRYIKDIFGIYTKGPMNNINEVISIFREKGVDLNQYIKGTTLLNIFSFLRKDVTILLINGVNPNKLEENPPYYSPFELSSNKFSLEYFLDTAKNIKMYGGDLIMRRSIYEKNIASAIYEGKVRAELLPAFDILDDDIFIITNKAANILPQLHMIGKTLRRSHSSAFPPPIVGDIIKNLLLSYNIQVSEYLLRFLIKYSMGIEEALDTRKEFIIKLNREIKYGM